MTGKSIVPQNLDEEKQLVLKAQEDPKAFDELYRHYKTPILQFISKNVNSVTIAEDLTSTVFEKALKYLPKYKWQEVSFGCWLFRIARNSLYDFYRSNNKNSRTSSLDEEILPHEDKSINLEANSINEESEMKLYEVIAQLDEDDQYLLYFKYFEGMDNGEIAEKMNISLSNVATKLHRIRGRMKKFL